MNAADAMPNVLESCGRVVRRARHVRIDDEALRNHAACVDRSAISTPAHPGPLRLPPSRETTANFVLLSDCLNFCFWSDRPWVVSHAGIKWTRTFAMLAGLVRAIQADPTWLEPWRWAEVEKSEVERMFAGEGEIPLLDERVDVLRETGSVLLSKYDGNFANTVEVARGHAPVLAWLLARDFPSFRDIAGYDGEPVAFLKRAQICAADLTSQWSATECGSLTGLEELTVFADYRLPQLFRHWGILKVSESLTRRIESKHEIAAGSAEEVELRAATVCAGDRLARSLKALPWKLDFFLWQRSHDPEVEVQHHRTRTIFY